MKSPLLVISLLSFSITFLSAIPINGSNQLFDSVLSEDSSALSLNSSKIFDTDNLGFTACHWAAANSDPAILQEILSLSKEINAENEVINALNKEGWAPIHMAVVFDRVQNVKTLLQSPTLSLNGVSTNGHNILHLAIMTGDEDLIRLLLNDSRLDAQTLLTLAPAPDLTTDTDASEEEFLSPLELAEKNWGTANSTILDLLRQHL